MKINVTLDNGNVINLSCDSTQDCVVLGYVMNHENTQSIIVESDIVDDNPLELEFTQTLDFDYHKQWFISISESLINEVINIHYNDGKLSAIKYLIKTYENLHPVLEEEKQPYLPLLIAKLIYKEITSGKKNYDESFYVNWNFMS